MLQTLVLILALSSFCIVESTKNLEPVARSGNTKFPSLMCEYHNLKNYLHIPKPKRIFTPIFLDSGKIRVCKPWTTIPTITTTPTPKVSKQPKITKQKMCEFHFSSLFCILMNSAKTLATTTTTTTTSATSLATTTTKATTTTNYKCKYHDLPKKWWKWSPFRATMRHSMVCKHVKQTPPSKIIPKAINTTIKTIPKENYICKVRVQPRR